MEFTIVASMQLVIIQLEDLTAHVNLSTVEMGFHVVRLTFKVMHGTYNTCVSCRLSVVTIHRLCRR